MIYVGDRRVNINSFAQNKSEDDKWLKPDGWPDIEAILSNDMHDYQYKRIELLNGSMLSTSLTGANAYYTSEGEFYSSNRTIAWDKLKDIVDETGNRYRWVMSFSTAGTFTNKCGTQYDLLWYLTSTGSKSTFTFNYLYALQMVSGDIDWSSTNNNAFVDCVSLVQIAGHISGYAKFQSCYNLKYLPADFKVPVNVMNTNQMFYNCRSLKRLPDDFSATNLSSAVYMFYNNTNLEHTPQNISLADGAVINNMFTNCASLKSVNFDFSNAGNLAQMFMGCYSLSSIPSTAFTDATNINGMLRDCPTGCKIGKFDFGDCQISSYGDFSHASFTFPEEFIATNMVGTAAFPGGYYFAQYLPKKIVVNVPITLNVGRIGTAAARERFALFDLNGDVNGGLVYWLYDNTSSSTALTITLQSSSTFKTAFTSDERSAIETYVASKNWTLAW